jgi:hypothetical protein
MNRPVAFLSWCGGLAFLAAAGALSATPAAADSFSFGYSSGYSRPYPHHYYHHPYFGPRYSSGVTFYAPPPVYYYPPPPPRVVYVPAPQMAYAPAPIDAVPASEPYRTSDGRYCREYQAQVMVGGVPQPSYGTACQQPDGSWRVIN